MVGTRPHLQGMEELGRKSWKLALVCQGEAMAAASVAPLSEAARSDARAASMRELRALAASNTQSHQSRRTASRAEEECEASYG